MSQELRITLVQIGPEVPGPNLLRAVSGTDIAVFPEMHHPGYHGFGPEDARAWAAAAVPADGAWVMEMRDAAVAAGCAVVAPFRERDGPRLYNSALLIDRHGDIRLHHRKVHICDFDTPESLLDRGERFGTTQIETARGSVTIGLMICMDREYPEAAGALSAAGAEVSLVPNCCHLQRDPLVGDVRLAQARGRAFETCMAIAMANAPSPLADGHSTVIDAEGQIIGQYGAHPEMRTITLDLGRVRAVREADHFRWQRDVPARSQAE